MSNFDSKLNIMEFLTDHWEKGELLETVMGIFRFF